MFNFKHKTSEPPLNAELTEAQTKLQSIKDQINQEQLSLGRLKQEATQYQSQIGEAQGIIEMIELGMEYTPSSSCLSDITWKLNEIQRQIACMISSNTIIQTTREYRINNSATKGREFQKTYCDSILIGFDSYVKSKESAVTPLNYQRTIDLICKTFEKYNKRAQLLGISINPEYLNLRTKLLSLKLDDKIAKTNERERIKEERRRLKEQEQLLAEAEKERKKLEDEKKAMDIAFNKALTDSERENIKAHMAEIDKRITDIDFRVTHQASGWLYVISSPALPNMVKIGTTRRLQPSLRVKELSSSSLPYPFAAHCFVFDDHVFNLETRVHQYFEQKRVSENREFFWLEPQRAIDVLKNKFNCEVHFTDNENESEEE